MGKTRKDIHIKKTKTRKLRKVGGTKRPKNNNAAAPGNSAVIAVKQNYARDERMERRNKFTVNDISQKTPLRPKRKKMIIIKKGGKKNARTKTNKKAHKKNKRKSGKNKRKSGKNKRKSGKNKRKSGKNILKRKQKKRKITKKYKRRMKNGGRLTPEEKKEMEIGRPDGCDDEQSTKCIKDLLDSLERNNINLQALSIAQLGILSDRPNESYGDFVERFSSIPDEKRKREFILDILHNMVYNDPNFDRSCLECPFIEDLKISNPTGSKIDALIIRHFPFLNPYQIQQSSFNFDSPTSRPMLRQGAYISDDDSLFGSDEEIDSDPEGTSAMMSRLEAAAFPRVQNNDGYLSDGSNSSYLNQENAEINIPNVERQATIGANLMDRFNEVDNNTNRNVASESPDQSGMSAFSSEFEITSGRENLIETDRNRTHAMWDYDSQEGNYFLVDPRVMPEYEYRNNTGGPIEMFSEVGITQIPTGHIPSIAEVRRLNGIFGPDTAEE